LRDKAVKTTVESENISKANLLGLVQFKDGNKEVEITNGPQISDLRNLMI
jgi:hypothetical protein